MKLSLYEQETIILYNQAEATAEVYTHDSRLLEKLRRLAEKYPDQTGNRTAPSVAKLPVNGPRLPGTGRPPPRKAMSKHG